MEHIFNTSGKHLAQELRDGKYSAVELIEAYIQEIQVVNPRLNAVVRDRFNLAREEAKASIQAALEFEKKEQWQKAIDAYNEALAALPEEETAKRMQLQLARANARIYVGELPEAMFAMEHLLDEAAKGDDKKLENKVRASLASAQSYTGWLMRLDLAE